MLATVVYYMDRQTLSVTARRIKSEMRLTNETFFYALIQELSVRHQGKVIGVLGTLDWAALSVFHPLSRPLYRRDRFLRYRARRSSAGCPWRRGLSCGASRPGSRHSSQRPIGEAAS